MSESYNPFAHPVGRDPLENPPSLLLNENPGYIDQRFQSVVASAAIVSEALDLPKSIFERATDKPVTNQGIVLVDPGSIQVNYASYLAKTRRFNSLSAPITQLNIHNAGMELGFVVPETGQIVIEYWPEKYDQVAFNQPPRTNYSWRLGRLLGERLIPHYLSNRFNVADVLNVTEISDSDITTMLLEQINLPPNSDQIEAWLALYDMLFNNSNPEDYYYQIQFKGKMATLIQRDLEANNESRFCHELYNPESYIIQELIKESYAILIDFLHYLTRLNADIGEDVSDPKLGLFMKQILKASQENKILLDGYLEERTPEWSMTFDHRFRINLLKAIIQFGGFESFIKELIDYETPSCQTELYWEQGSPQYRLIKNTVKSYLGYRSVREMLHYFQLFPPFYTHIVKDIRSGRHTDFIGKVMQQITLSDDPERLDERLSTLFSPYPYPASSSKLFLTRNNSGRFRSVSEIVRIAIHEMEQAKTRYILKWCFGV